MSYTSHTEKKILLTGASGFVGGHLSTRLAREPGQATTAAVRQASRGLLSKQLPTIGIDPIGPETRWQDALAGVNVVIHAAARVHVMDEQAADPLAEYRRVNTAGTLHLAREAAKAGVRRLIFLSTVKVLGDSTRPGRPFRVDDPPAPSDPYAISKHEAEEGLRQIAAKTSLEVVVIRPPLVYGAGVGGNFARLLDAVARRQRLPLAAIDNRRSLVFVDNLVDLIIKCIDHDKAPGRAWLVSDGEDLSTPELVRRLAAQLNQPPRLLPVPPALLRLAGFLTGRRAAVDRLTGSLQVDISATRELLGWQPPVTVDEGLRSLWTYYKSVNQ